MNDDLQEVVAATSLRIRELRAVNYSQDYEVAAEELEDSRSGRRRFRYGRRFLSYFED